MGMQIDTATMKNNMEIPYKKLGIKLPFDPTIPLLVTFSEETITENDKCIQWSCMDVRVEL